MGTEHQDEWRASNPAELGRALARLRKQSGLSQEAMAHRIGVNRSYLARMETGLSTGQLQRTFAVLREAGFELALVPRDST